MKQYILSCYNTKEKLVFKIELCMSERRFESQIEKGYLRFIDKKYGETICYLNQYARVVINKRGGYDEINL